MARPIDADELEFVLCVKCAFRNENVDYPCKECWIIDTIHRQHTIDSLPIRIPCSERLPSAMDTMTEEAKDEDNAG